MITLKLTPEETLLLGAIFNDIPARQKAADDLSGVLPDFDWLNVNLADKVGAALSQVCELLPAA